MGYSTYQRWRRRIKNFQRYWSGGTEGGGTEGGGTEGGGTKGGTEGGGTEGGGTEDGGTEDGFEFINKEQFKFKGEEYNIKLQALEGKTLQCGINTTIGESKVWTIFINEKLGIEKLDRYDKQG